MVNISILNVDEEFHSNYNYSEKNNIILNWYDDCSHDPLVNFEFKTERFTGYLTVNNIIRVHNKFDCEIKRIWIREIRMKIAFINSKEVTLANPKYSIEIGSLDSEFDKLSFFHDETIKAIELLNVNFGDFDSKLNITQMYQDSYDAFIDTNVIMPGKKLINFRIREKTLLYKKILLIFILFVSILSVIKLIKFIVYVLKCTKKKHKK